MHTWKGQVQNRSLEKDVWIPKRRTCARKCFGSAKRDPQIQRDAQVNR